jgi:outer membrane receptor for ferrienterochelin and colicins
LNLNCIALILLLSFQQPARGVLIVEVRSRGHEVIGAQVRAAGQKAQTDDRGRAQLSLPAGTYSVTIEAEAFQTSTTTVRVDSAAETRVEVELAPRVSITEQVIVTAARTNSRIEDEPVRIEVVDREDIEEKALMTPGSVAMLLGETTGLRVQTTAPAIGAANVRIQGLRGRYSQVLSDGLPLYGLQGDSLSLLQVPPLDLGQVEVIKGAASALYGPSALGGVVNLVSQRPQVRHRELLVNQSTEEATDLTFWAVEPPHGNWAFTLLGGLHGQQKQDLDHDGWADLPQFLRGVFRPRLFWDDGKGRTVFATVGIMAEDRSGGTMPDGHAPDGQPFREDLDSRRLDAGIIVSLPAGNGRVWTIKASASHRGERRLFGDVLERDSRDNWFGEAVLVGNTGRHTWVIGGAIQQDRYSDRDFPAFDYNFTTPSLIVQDEFYLVSQLTLGVSARVDHHSRYGTFASPRVSLLYKPAPGWSLRLSTGTGFFAPTPFIEETEETGLSRVRPLGKLVAERARSASLDASWTRGPIELVATAFGSRVQDPIQRRILSKDSVELVNAGGAVRTWGTELLARYRIEDFTLLATHAYTCSTEENPEAPGRRDVPLTPRNVVSLNAIWQKENRGRIGLEAYYIGRQPLEDNPYRSMGRTQFLYGVFAERRFGRVRFFGNLENIGNVRQTRYDPLLLPERAPDGRWTVDAWAPLDGRVLNGGIRVTF